jgi:hypothetical protein
MLAREIQAESTANSQTFGKSTDPEVLKYHRDNAYTREYERKAVKKPVAKAVDGCAKSLHAAEDGTFRTGS